MAGEADLVRTWVKDTDGTKTGNGLKYQLRRLDKFSSDEISLLDRAATKLRTDDASDAVNDQFEAACEKYGRDKVKHGVMGVKPWNDITPEHAALGLMLDALDYPPLVAALEADARRRGLSGT